MATVYLADDAQHRRKVVVKVLRSELASVVSSERFLAEIEITAHLQHPHIVSLFDSGDLDGLPWFVMPYIEGESLRQRLDRERQLPIDEAVRLTTEIASALDYAHRQGVVHRDVKPENILLHDGHAHVADFGIALALDEAGRQRLTQTGVSIGTPAYMSPEQCAADRQVDARTDQYSLACVLYEMLTGEAPFTAPTPQAIMGRRMREPVPHLSPARDVPRSIELAIMRALSRTPAERYASVSEFSQALHVSSPVRRPWRRPAAAAAISLLTLGIVAYGAIARWRRSSALDGNLIAVAPFDAPLPELAMWREAIVDYLSPNLDGSGPLRVVPASIVLRSWAGRADKSSATALAARTGAGIVLFGAVTLAGRDSIHVSAHVLDALAGTVSDVDARDANDRIDRLIDSLTGRVLRELSRTRIIGAVRSAGLGSPVVSAVKAYLRGEQAIRRAEWESAREAYEQALELDSGFMLARRRLARVVSWQMGTGGNGKGDRTYLSLSDFRYMRSLTSRGRSLGERDSLLVAADSQRAALVERDVADTLLRGRLFATAAELVRRYPNDAEAWTVLGDVRYYFGGYIGALYCGPCATGQADVSTAEILAAYAAAIELDPGFAPPYQYAFRLALDLGDVDRARRYASSYLALKPSAEMSTFLRVVLTFLQRPAEQTQALDRYLDTLPPDIVWRTYATFLLLPDSAATAVRLGLRLSSDHAAGGVFRPSEPQVRRRPLAGALAYRGRVADAYRVTGDSRSQFFSPLYAELAMFGAVPADSADLTFHRWLRENPFTPNVGLDFALPWWSRRGDTVAFHDYLRRATREHFDSTASHFNTQPHLRVSPSYRRAVALAYLALARRDTAEALNRFLQIQRGTWWLNEPLTLALLLEARHRDREALEVLDRPFPYSFATPTRGLVALERGRVAQRLGQREEAIASYQFVTQLWRDADSNLQVHVAEARTAMLSLADHSR
jgi:serine/threonine-protein kinase